MHQNYRFLNQKKINEWVKDWKNRFGMSKNYRNCNYSKSSENTENQIENIINIAIIRMTTDVKTLLFIRNA